MIPPLPGLIFPAMKTRTLLLGLVVVAAGMGQAAGFNVPQSREEFVKAVTTGARGAAVETLTVDRSVGDIYGTLKKTTSTCLDVTVKRSGFVGGQMESSLSDYNPTLGMIDGNRVEFSLQVVHRPRAIGENAPPGGLYVMVVNIRPLGARRSEVVLYRPTIGYKKVVTEFKQWVAGEDTGCPKMK